MAARPSMGFGFIGNLGGGNLGDEASLAAVLSYLKREFPGAYYCGLTGNPEDTRQRHNIDVFPGRKEIYFRLRNQSNHPTAAQRDNQELAAPPAGVELSWRERLKRVPLIHALGRAALRFFDVCNGVYRELVFLAAVRRKLKGVDILISAGGGQFADNFTGPFGYPYYMLRWVLFSKVFGKKIVFLNCGAMPLHSNLSRLFSRLALKWVDYKSYRDDTTRRILESLGDIGDAPILPDVAYALDISDIQIPSGANTMVVGINLFPHGDKRYWPEDKPEVYRHYLSTMAEFSLWVLEQGFQITYFATQVRADSKVIEDMLALLRDKPRAAPLLERVTAVEETTVPGLLQQIALMDLVVCTRFHGILFAFLLNKPVLGLFNQPKMQDLMKDMGQGNYLMDLNDLEAEMLVKRFQRLDQDQLRIKTQIDSKVAEFRQQLEGQFETVFLQQLGLRQ